MRGELQVHFAMMRGTKTGHVFNCVRSSLSEWNDVVDFDISHSPQPQDFCTAETTGALIQVKNGKVGEAPELKRSPANGGVVVPSDVDDRHRRAAGKTLADPMGYEGTGEARH
jgi:hypothetical protein